jgi:hypothetical protein
MSHVYVLKVSSKHKKSMWRKIQIKESQTLGHLDRMMRDTFNYEQHDHLSEFFRGKVWESPGYGEIQPGGKGPGATKLIKSLGINIGNKMEYVYDFGANVISIVELVGIQDEDPKLTYPRISEKNKQRNIYCERCKTNGKKKVALYTVYDFEDDSVERLCEECSETVSEDVDVSEIVY